MSFGCKGILTKHKVSHTREKIWIERSQEKHFTKTVIWLSTKLFTLAISNVNSLGRVILCQFTLKPPILPEYYLFEKGLKKEKGSKCKELCSFKIGLSVTKSWQLVKLPFFVFLTVVVRQVSIREIELVIFVFRRRGRSLSSSTIL